MSSMAAKSEVQSAPKPEKSSSNQVKSRSGSPKFELRDTKFIEKVPPKSYAEIEASLWKNNIKYGPRVRKDWLDVSNEDFSLQRTHNIEGKIITPSNFNIFRDSLRTASKELEKRLIENLPDMNLSEIDSSGSSD